MWNYIPQIKDDFSKRILDNGLVKFNVLCALYSYAVGVGYYVLIHHITGTILRILKGQCHEVDIFFVGLNILS